jgi:hypothetical protein
MTSSIFPRPETGWHVAGCPVGETGAFMLTQMLPFAVGRNTEAVEKTFQREASQQ